ncbi:pyruvate kinase [Heliomicrobium modesticaldum Ice1]|uniref:Pyruvate kinase n=1 Tax=Heliobacterium modesticaldum (strain ATCC 51547 / Ice1) TaxID=498761 RepID=B0TI28_HELMI|nr:pyruvate kinase [Heliomicrobium modesticaldum]ABZ82701.1 pyruvate kinase [Heliomicrobium modesticaldum Ice1]
MHAYIQKASLSGTPRTKIVCTVGPASSDPTILMEMIRAGMRVARLNFSHGTYEEHAARIAAVRQAADALGQPIAILLDTKGPEIRLGQVSGGKITLDEGAEVTLFPDDGTLGTKERLPISYAGLVEDVRPGVRVLIDDGNIEMEVTAVEAGEIRCRIKNGGDVSSRKGVSVPGVALRMPAISEKEVKDLEFGIAQDMDFVAISFVRDASDVLGIRKILEDRGASMQLIAKIENHQGVDNIDEILAVSDGIMVARGDLGVAIPTEDVPLVQKMIIEKCNIAGKPVITATQMLDSMIRNPRPTRAEATDVANAILDGTDAIMLSGETAAGKYPVEAVTMMARIAIRTEQALRHDEELDRRRKAGLGSVTDSISHATCSIAADLKAKAIITLTKAGSTARMVSRYRPDCPIIAATPETKVMRQMAVVWGAEPMKVRETAGTDEMLGDAIDCALKEGRIESGDLVVVTAGVPVGVSGTTNLLKVHVAGRVLAHGMGISRKKAVGKVRLCRSAADAARLERGEILVAYGTDRDYVPALERCAGIITVEGGLTSHAAIVGLQFGIPVIVGVDNAFEVLPDGAVVTIDATERGMIYEGTARVL